MSKSNELKMMLLEIDSDISTSASIIQREKLNIMKSKHDQDVIKTELKDLEDQEQRQGKYKY